MRDRRLAQLDDLRVEIGARVTALVLVFMVAATTGGLATRPWQLALLAVLAAAAVVPLRSPELRRWRPLAEGCVAALLVATSDPYQSALLPYLVVPSLSAGLIGGWSLAVITAGATGLVLMSRGLMIPDGLLGTGYLVDITQWTLLALAIGLLAAWLRRVQNQRPTEDQSYLEATRLLTQLRDLSRELSGGLDVVSIAGGLLEHLQRDVEADRGWVFGYRDGAVPLLLATSPLGESAIDPDLDSRNVWTRALHRGAAQSSSRGFTADPSMSGVVAPLRVQDTTVGLVALERRGRGWDEAAMTQVQRLADAHAIRIDAALLFDEVRTLAASEERQRLAREIHDGVAQEVASLGYLIDDLTARAGPDAKPQLRQLRAELSRVVTELRFSIFDLRREIGPGVSLTAALAEHARHVGKSSGVTVHLELSETPRRLRTQVESELFRIAQEAIANSRKHAHAENVWVTCLVDAPEVFLRIEDDGRGTAPLNNDNVGVAIMRERAERASCTLTIAERAGGGTSVVVRPDRRDEPKGVVRRDDSRAAR